MVSTGGTAAAAAGEHVALTSTIIASYKAAAVSPCSSANISSSSSSAAASAATASIGGGGGRGGRGRRGKEMTKLNSPNAAAFSVQGDRCAFSYASGRIVLFDAIQGTQLKEIHEKETGVTHLCFAHHDLSILFADSEIKPEARTKIVSTFESSEEEDNDHPVRYLSLHDNQYLHLYYGHRSPVSSICLFPTHSAFLSGSVDGYVRMWDLRQADARLCIRPSEDSSANQNNASLSAHVAADPSGDIFAVASGLDVSLYDARKHEAPFSVFQPAYYSDNRQDFQDVYATDVQFIGDGKLMITTSNGSISLVNDGANHTIGKITKEGETLRRILSKRKTGNVAHHMSHVTRPSCSPDGAFVVQASGHHVGVHASTSSGGAVAEKGGGTTGEDTGIYWSGHENDVTALCWSPTSELVVSGSSDAIAFWLPSEHI